MQPKQHLDLRPENLGPPRHNSLLRRCGVGLFRVYTRRRREIALLLLLAMGGSIYLHRDFWNAAWRERSLLPQGVARLVHWQQGQPAFDLRRLTIPRKEILGGGPPKDGIPALTDPALLAVAAADYLRDEDRVVGVHFEGEARAYPLIILTQHEIVNDRIGETPFVVTYCPLCDSAAVFDRRTPLGERRFGVSGLLYNSNVLMFDRGGEPESLWSQVKGEGVSGPAAGQPLTPLPSELTTWAAWRGRHPETKVLSQATGHRRDYRHDPYAAYFRSPRLMFPAKPLSRALPLKEPVLGVWVGGEARAYPVSRFNESRLELKDTLGGKNFTLAYDPAAGSLRVREAEEGVGWMYSFWFAWHAFRPATEIAD